MITKLSLIDSSSSSLKYSVRTCQSAQFSYGSSLNIAYVGRGWFQQHLNSVLTGPGLGESAVRTWKRRTVQIVMSDVHIVDPPVRETRRDLNILLFHVQYQGKKLFDVRRIDIIPIWPLYQRLQDGKLRLLHRLRQSHLALDVQNGDYTPSASNSDLILPTMTYLSSPFWSLVDLSYTDNRLTGMRMFPPFTPRVWTRLSTVHPLPRCPLGIGMA